MALYCVFMCAGAAETDRGRPPRLLPAPGVYPAVEVLHSSVPSPHPAQPRASSSQPQGGEKVGTKPFQTNGTCVITSCILIDGT